jgi:histidinol-phosphate phosphatase family protein
MQAVILAGGKGTRLAERLNGQPKPLVDVCGIPLLQRQIETLRISGVDRIVLLVNHKADQIREFCARNASFGIDVAIVDDGDPRGTAGALLACLERLEDRFLVVYGDTLFDIDIARMMAAHEDAGADVTLLVHPNDHPADSDLVSARENGRIKAFHPYPHPPEAILPNLVNAAFYIVQRVALERWADFPVPADLAKDLFPAMVSIGQHLLAYRSFEYIKDLGTPRRLDKVEAHLRAGRPARSRLDVRQPCVFLDRDGTLNNLRGHLARAQDLDLLPGAAIAVRHLNDAEYRVAVITNQPVLARGDCTPEELERIHWKLESLLGAEGAFLDGIWFCPHHPDAGFPGEVPHLKRGCDCRKPKPGLILESAVALNGDIARSWMIGDTTSDMLAAHHAGLGTILVLTGEGGRDGKYVCSPDFVAADLAAAVRLILEDVPRWTIAIETAIAQTGADIRSGEAVLLEASGNEIEVSAMTANFALMLRRRGLEVETKLSGRRSGITPVVSDPALLSNWSGAIRRIRIPHP